MIEIPQYYKEKLTKAMGSKVELWLEKLPRIATDCIKKWSLSDTKIVDNLSYNFLMFAYSHQYGKVVLKISIPDPEAYSEMKALSLFMGETICKCYAFDVENYAMLLEKLEPGDNLKSIKNLHQRYKIFADIVKNLASKTGSHEGICIYEDWLQRAFSNHRKRNDPIPQLIGYIDIAEKLFAEKNEKFDKTLLHGDLHHENILLAEDGVWKCIDPKGAIGIKPLEVGRFMINQMIFVEGDDKEIVLNEMVAVFSNAFNYSADVIASCCFIDSVLTTTWHCEGNHSFDVIKPHLERCGIIKRICELH